MNDAPLTPPLVRGGRNMRDSEKLTYRERTGPAWVAMDRNLIFHDTGPPTLPSVYVDPATTPGYPLMALLEERIPLDTFRRVMYCITENTELPIGSLVSPDILNAARAVYNATDERSEVLAVEFRQRDGIGRFYAAFDTARARILPGGLVGSQLTLPKYIRSTLWAKHGVVDLDQQKSHPTLMTCVGRLFGIYTPGLEAYLTNPDAVLAELAAYWTDQPDNPVTTKDVKRLINRTVYGGGFAAWRDELQSGTTTDMFRNVPTYTGAPKLVRVAPHPAIYADIHEECRVITDLVYTANVPIVTILRTAHPNITEHAMRCKTLSYFCGCIEHHLSYTALSYCREQGMFRERDGHIQAIWGYDGFSWIPPRGVLVDDAFLARLNAHIHLLMGPAFTSVKFIRKEHSPDECIGAVLDDNHPLWSSAGFRVFDVPIHTANPNKISRQDELQMMSLKSYEEWKLWFELSHFKVEDPTSWGWVEEAGDSFSIKVNWYTHQQLIIKYENYMYTGPNKKGEIVQQQGLSRWLKDPAMRVYARADVYPPPLRCPADTFNMWTDSPFHKQRRAPRDSDATHIATFLALLAVVCDGDALSIEYLVFWICHMLQLPAEKIGTVPVLVGSEGTGKSLFSTIVGRLVGIDRYLETTLNNVVGPFNSLLDGKLLVCLNELSNNLGGERTALLKQLLTDPYVTINRKGHPQYTIRSFHRFICTSNLPGCLDSDRRPFYCKSAWDIMLPEHEPLKDAAIALQNNQDGLAAIYAWFMDIDMVARFGATRVKPPVNALNRGYKAMRQPYAQFCWSLVDKYWNSVSPSKTYTALDIFTQFEEWTTAQHLTITTHGISSVEQNILTISWPPGCISNEITLARGGRARVYNFAAMRDALAIIYPRNDQEEVQQGLVPEV